METSSMKIVEVMVISISNKLNLRTRNIIGDKEGHYIIMKGSIARKHEYHKCKNI